MTTTPTKQDSGSKVSAVLEWFFREIQWTVRVLASSADRFYWDNGFSKAAALAYTSILSLVPAMALGCALLASFAVSKQYVPDVRRFIFKQFVPNMEVVDTILNHLTQFSETVSSLNLLVILFLVVTSVLLINSIEYVLNEIWQVYEPRSYSSRIMVFCTIIVLAPILALSAYYTAKVQIEPLLNNIVISPYFNVGYNYILPFLIDFLAFLFLYFMVPKAPVKMHSASFGAFIAALFFGVAKASFTFYIVQFSSYEKIYGTIAAIPVFLFWLYLAWSIVLFGCETCYQAQYLPRRGKLWKHSVLSVGDAKLVLALQSILMVEQAFREGKKLPNDWEISEALGCSSVVLRPVLSLLEKAGIVAWGDSRDMPLTLLKSPNTISLIEIKDALSKSTREIRHSNSIAKFFRCFHDTEKLKVTTLADIIKDQG